MGYSSTLVNARKQKSSAVTSVTSPSEQPCAMPNKSHKKQKKVRRQQKAASAPQQGVFPPTRMAKLNYSDVSTLTEGGAGTGAFQVYRTGDLYDPDYTGVGHQPMYFDQLCSSTGPYLTFAVLGAGFQLRFANVSSYPALVVIFPSMGTASPASRQQALEKPFAKKRLLPPVGTGGAMWDCRYHISNPKFAGQPPQTYIANNGGNFGSSAGGPNMIVCVYGIGGVASVAYEVNILYHAKFMQLGPQSTS